MRRRSSAIKSIVVVTLLLLVLPDALQAKADSDGGNEKEIITTTKLLVKYKATSNYNNNLRTSTTNSNSNDGYVHQLLGNRVRSIANLSEKGHLALIDVDNEQKELVIQELMADNNVLHVEEDFEIRKTPAIEDEEGGGHEKDTITNLRRSLEELQQYGNKLIQADDVWATVASHPNEPVKVCIIDTGYNINHEDLPHSGVSQTDVGYGSSFLDMDGHGTHCAGVIGAIGNNQLGIVGVNPDYTKFSFHIVKALSDEGVGTASAVLRAIQGCIDGGSKIISMSIGGGPNSAIFRDEYERAYDEGVLLVSASGNQGQPIHDYPASYPTVISVGAVDQNGNRAEFSNYSDQLELMAPGVSIKSTYLNSGYRSLSGTSMATPYVAGAFALVWGYFPKCSNHQIRNVFARTARSISKDASGCDEMNGFGIIQAKAAFDALNQYGCEYGGDDSIPRSLGAIGGCEQTRILTAKTLPPSSSPTEKPTSPPFTIHFFTNSPTEQSTSVSPPTSLFTLPIMFPKPLDNPTNSPTYSPTSPNTISASKVVFLPSLSPPTDIPSAKLIPSELTNSPTTSSPTNSDPSSHPTSRPSASPSKSPTPRPSTSGPSTTPTILPIQMIETLLPSAKPTTQPSTIPTADSTPTQDKAFPSVSPTANPSLSPSDKVTLNPSLFPSLSPSHNPTSSPSYAGWTTKIAEDFIDRYGVFAPGGENVRWTSERLGRLGLVMFHSGKDTPTVKSSLVSEKVIFDAPYRECGVFISFYANGHLGDVRNGTGNDGFCFDYASNLASGWTELKCWRINRDFETEQWYDEEQIQFSFDSDHTIDFIRIRLRSDSDDRLDRIFLDKVDLLLSIGKE